MHWTTKIYSLVKQKQNWMYLKYMFKIYRKIKLVFIEKMTWKEKSICMYCFKDILQRKKGERYLKCIYICARTPTGTICKINPPLVLNLPIKIPKMYFYFIWNKAFMLRKTWIIYILYLRTGIINSFFMLSLCQFVILI